ncbi:hypothetical protein NC651_021280 [Populus alba x Populus x berolinensis]|nr:hypothetical protein NC651_021280 [Populus alba x Populus x berolinensis]
MEAWNCDHDDVDSLPTLSNSKQASSFLLDASTNTIYYQTINDSERRLRFPTYPLRFQRSFTVMPSTLLLTINIKRWITIRNLANIKYK